MKRILVVAAVGALAACGLEKQAAPSLTGPSGLALSLAVTATPDIISQDGVSSSSVQIVARDANSQPINGVSLRAEIAVGGSIVDFGALSSRTVSTGADGSAAITYFSPPPPPSSVTSDTIVTVLVTPAGTDFANSLTRSVLIRLARPGVILPPGGGLPANFVFSPTQPREHETILFEASSSEGILTYDWTFGDGAAASGSQVTHRFDLAGTYNVTLTVTDNVGRTGQVVKQVTVTAAVAPIASFVVSPTDPVLGATGSVKVFFNAATSKPSPGFQIVAYNWSFGDGDTGSGATVDHDYTAAGTFAVVLTIIDGSGQTASFSQTVTVTGEELTADFVFSPTDPDTTTLVSFNAATSRPSPGAAIVKYEWNFGDGGPTKTGETQTNTFGTAGTYTVVLTVEDSTGLRASVAKTVVVKP